MNHMGSVQIRPSDTAVLEEGLDDPSAEMRVASFEALRRIPLAPATWRRVAGYAIRVLGSGDSREERIAVIDAVPALPLSGPRAHLRYLAAHGDPEEQEHARKALSSDVADQPAAWKRDGFWMSAYSDRVPDSKEVTRLLEQTTRGQIDTNQCNRIVDWVDRHQERFLPDIPGLLALYRPLAVAEWAELRREGSPFPAFFNPGRESSARWLCWQIAWVASRAGLPDLLRALAEHLSASSLEERLAAACLIADAAAYAEEVRAPIFGGGCGPDPPAPVALPPDETMDDVQFTVYRPSQAVADRWYPLLAFVHTTSRATTSDGAVIDPLEVVKEQADSLLKNETVSYGPTRADADVPLRRGSDLVIEPWIDRGEANPARASIRWLEPVHRADFRIRVSGVAAGTRLPGGVRVFVGPLLIGEVTFRIVVGTTSSPTATPVADTALRYRRIFASYSHQDTDVVREVTRCAELIGDRYLLDVRSLRSGEQWNQRLAEMIDSADVFQLFWSRNAMRSHHVRHEWEHALELTRPGFVRPFYWEQPFPEDPASGLPPEALRALHFARLEPIHPDRPPPVRARRARPALGMAIVLAAVLIAILALWILSR